ncbi:MAG: hypothetical protein K1W02_09795 [Muribaculaceae bacterium]
MSDKDMINQRNILNEALKESFRKMIEIKKRMDLPIVTSDCDANPIVLTAEEAEKLLDMESLPSL